MQLSIITVCLNSKALLEKTLASVFSQTWQNFEYIIVDGKSTDGTIALIDNYLSRGIQVISEKDTGIYNAMNKGIRKAQGDYLLFLNAGDVFVDERVLERIFATNPREDLIYCNILLESKGKIIGEKLYPDIIEKTYWQKDFLCHQAVLHRHTVFERFGLYNEELRYVSDHELFFKAWSSPGTTARHLPITSIVYNMDGVSSDPKNRSKILAEYKKILKKYFDLNLGPRRFSPVRLYAFLRHHVRTLWDSVFPRNNLTTLNCDLDERQTKLPRVLLLNTSDSYGGAARAVQRIKRSFAHGRFRIILAVKTSTTADSTIIIVPTKRLHALVIPLLRLLRLRFGAVRTFRTQNPILHSPAYTSKLDTMRVINHIDPDVVHLNWIGDNLLTIEEIRRIKKPIVWTFHDMWPFCGAEHVSYDERYITGYTERNRPPGDSGFDLNRWVWNRKMKAFRSLQNLSIVCPSDWLAECVERSLIFRGRNIYVVPNGLDTNVFCPMERSEVRRELNLPADRTILLFGAMDSTADKNKGYHLLMATLNILATSALKDKLQLVVFGNRITLPNELMGIPIRGFGMISDDSLLARLYSAADVTIVPSLIESFGQTASESLACGTPVACFDTSGLKSVVDHRENGYRAKCYSPEDLADGILWICADSGRHRTLSEAGRRKAETHFGLDRLAAGYAKVYDDLLSQSKRK